MGSSMPCAHQPERNLDDQAPERIVTVATRATRAILHRPPFAQPVTGLCSTRVQYGQITSQGSSRSATRAAPCRTQSMTDVIYSC